MSLQAWWGWGVGLLFVESRWEPVWVRARFSGLTESCVHLALDAPVPPPLPPPPPPPGVGLGSPGHRVQVPGHTLNRTHLPVTQGRVGRGQELAQYVLFVTLWSD